MAPHLYLHVPFCVQKCAYCAFFSVADKDHQVLDRYVEALTTEARARIGDCPPFKTVYFGGGTPSLLGARRVEKILRVLGDNNALDTAEVTLEANPESVTKELLRALKHAGINRVSLGLQSFHDDALDTLGRCHNARQGEAALEAALTVFGRVSVDLMYGLPGQTVTEWEADLKRVAALGTEHLSAYELTYEKGTPMGDRPHGRDDRTEFFFATHQILAAEGLEGYEVSNFARSSTARSRHNLATWAYAPYLGLGPGAHSFSGPGAGATRRWNLASIASYLSSSPGEVPHETERVNSEQQRLERLMLGLRTRIGVNLLDLYGDPGVPQEIQQQLKALEQRKLVVLDGTQLTPTLEGMGLADGLAAHLSG